MNKNVLEVIYFWGNLQGKFYIPVNTTHVEA